MFFRIHFFWPMDFTQCVDIYHIFFTDIGKENLFEFERFSIKICYTIQFFHKGKIRTIFDGRNAEQARNC